MSTYTYTYKTSQCYICIYSYLLSEIAIGRNNFPFRHKLIRVMGYFVTPFLPKWIALERQSGTEDSGS